MISVQQATEAVFTHPGRRKVITVPLQEAVGHVLAEPVKADRDLPPFHRVTMDGIAICYEAWKNGTRKFAIEAMASAGEPQRTLTNPHHAIEVMTGAVLPAGADTVIRYEDITIAGGEAMVNIGDIEAGQSLHRQGQDARREELLLEAGTMVTPSEIAVLASVGKARVEVFGYPATALVASGDELVDIEASPLLHQVRRSNMFALQAAMRTMGWRSTEIHLRDEKEMLRGALRELLAKNDVIILSGGVSQGKFDFIPAVMEEIGVKKIFHQVSQRPGKPFWFGASPDGKTVFALPGNPVSTFMCFYRYVKPWMLRTLGITTAFGEAILARDFSFMPRLTYFLQVSVRNEGGRMMAYPDAGGGSGDFVNLRKVDGFLELPPGRSEFKAGEAFPYIPFRQ